MLNKWHYLKQHALLLLAGICTSTALAQPCTELLIASYTPGNVCSGRPLNLSANTIAGATYTWTGPSGFFSAGQNPTIPSVAINQSGSYIVTATAGACVYKDTVNVTVNQSPGTPVMSLNSPPCKGSALSIQLSGSGIPGTTYALYTPGGAPYIPIFSLQPSHNGTYKAVASLPNGCKSDTAYLPVAVIDLPAPTLLADTPICRGDTLHMYVMNNTPVVDNYYWNTPSSSPFYTLPQPLHLPNVTIGGFYTVQTVRDGCLSPVAYSLITFLPSFFANVSIMGDGEIHTGHTELVFTAHITNGGGTPGVQWYRNGAAIQNANDTMYKGTLFTDILPSDWFYVRVERDSACGGISYSDTIYVSQVLDVPAITQENGVSIYPNPNNGTFFLRTPMLKEKGKIEVINAVGQLILSRRASMSSYLEIELPANISNGMYLLRLTDGEQTLISRFTVNR